jgi:hypothetical protein
MIKYLITCENLYSCKNKLENQVQEYLRTQDRSIIANTQIEQFKQMIVDEINAINAKHPRCKAIRSEWWASDRHEDASRQTWILSFAGASICNFKALAGEEVEI